MTVTERDLPKGWVWSTLGEVCFGSQYGWTTSAAPEGNVQFLRTTDITSGSIDWATVPYCKDSPPNIDKYLLRDGDIVISRAGSVGYSILVRGPKPAVFASYLIRFRPLYDPKYTAYFLQSAEYWNAISEQSLGIAIPNVNASKLRQIPFPLAPLPEQRRIVAKIEELFTRLDAGVAALKRVQAALKRYKASVLKAACEGRLVPQDPSDEPADVLLKRILAERRAKWEGDLRDKGKDPKKAKYEEPEAPDIENLSELPKGWRWSEVSQVGHVQLGRQRTPKHHLGPYMRPYLRVANVFEDRIDTGDVLAMNFTPSEYEVYRLKPGDILLNEGQSPEFLGRPAMYRGEVPGACFQNTLIRFQANSAVIPEYALTVFRYHLHTGRFAKEATITTNIAHLSGGRFSRIEFPLPPLAEQRRIVSETDRCLSVAFQLENAIGANISRATRLRQSILAQAFSGKLVPQDPTDEPAENLLTPILAEGNDEPEVKAAKKPARRKVRAAT